MKAAKLIKVVLLISLLGLCFWKIYKDLKASFRPAVAPSVQLASSPNRLKIAGQKERQVDIEVHPMMELDFKTKAEILSTRRLRVQEHSDFFAREYAPSKAVFGQIEDRKGWWGILGICFYGDGPKSIEGLSEESRFLGNPFLLVGVHEIFAIRFKRQPSTFTPYHPELEKLSWSFNKDRLLVRATYDVARHFEARMTYRTPGWEKRELTMTAYNARDFGYGFMYVDPKRSKNVKSRAPAKQPIRLVQYIHKGYSCKYKGGCNNMSPNSKLNEIELSKTPATAYIKIWEKEPKSVNDPSDVDMILDLQ